MRWIPCLLILTSITVGALGRPAEAADFEINVVAGNDASGFDQALQTARQHRQQFPADTIIIRLPRTITVTAPLTLTAQDSGREGAPLIIRGASSGGTTVSGGHALETRVPAASEMAAPQMSFRSLPGIRVASLEKQWDKITPPFQPMDSLKELPRGKLLLFEGDRRLAPARWPVEGYARNPDIFDNGQGAMTLGLPTRAPDAGDDPNLWIAGYWAWNWWFETAQVTNSQGGNLRFAKPVNNVREGARYYVYNMAAALDRPGFFYLDVQNKRIFYLPETGKGTAKLEIPLADSLLNVKNATNVRIESVAFEKATGPAVLIENSRDVTIADCYIGHTGGDGIDVEGGLRVTIDRCVVDDTGYSGVSLSGGNRKTLAPGGHSVIRTSISRFGQEMPTYRPGVRLFGVGQTVESCEISQGPHAGIIYFGNDHVIKGNLIHDVALNTDDTGAIYTGRNWTNRGTLITGNYIHDVINRIGTTDLRGVYLDDQSSGTTVTANIFRNIDEAILVGGGRDNLIQANLFLGVKRAIRLDSRGTTWEADMVKEGGALWNSLHEMPYLSPIYTSRYPGLATILTDRRGSPLNNRFIQNLSQVSPVIDYEAPASADLGVDADNLGIGGKTTDLRSALDSGPANAPALEALRRLPAAFDDVTRMMATLPFAGKAR